METGERRRRGERRGETERDGDWWEVKKEEVERGERKAEREMY